MKHAPAVLVAALLVAHSRHDVELVIIETTADRRLDIPISAIGGKGVFVKDGKYARWKKVTTGIADDAVMEIKDGIKPGDEVISGSYSAISRKLKDGAKVVYDKEAAK